MEEGNELELGIGTKEPVTLKPGKVLIRDVVLERDIKNKKGEIVGDKVGFYCKHPDKEEVVIISGIKHEVAGKLKAAGAWLSKDEDGLLQKRSALASLLRKYEVTTPKEMNDKEVETVEDDKGYLCIKAYWS